MLPRAESGQTQFAVQVLHPLLKLKTQLPHGHQKSPQSLAIRSADSDRKNRSSAKFR